MDSGGEDKKDNVETGEYGSEEDVDTHCDLEDVIDNQDDT